MRPDVEGQPSDGRHVGIVPRPAGACGEPAGGPAVTEENTSTRVADFLHDVINLSEEIDSPKAERAAMFASDLLAKAGAAKEDTCLARAMGYTGPTGEGTVSGVAEGVLTRSHDALRQYGADVDIATVTAGLSAAARLIRKSAALEHAGCLSYMTRALLGADAGLAPKRISRRVSNRAEPNEAEA
jgi:hypothetical protein